MCETMCVYGKGKSKKAIKAWVCEGKIKKNLGYCDAKDKKKYPNVCLKPKSNKLSKCR